MNEKLVLKITDTGGQYCEIRILYQYQIGRQFYDSTGTMGDVWVASNGVALASRYCISWLRSELYVEGGKLANHPTLYCLGSEDAEYGEMVSASIPRSDVDKLSVAVKEFNDSHLPDEVVNGVRIIR